MILSIIGFMGCGKSSVGRKLSELLCCRFMDLDQMIEAEAGKSIAEIFAEVGESGFREMELKVLDRAVPMPVVCRRPTALSCQETLCANSLEILSLGGGTVMTRECAEIVRERTVCVYLRASVETLAEHLEGETEGRPMLAGNSDCHSDEVEQREKSPIRERITELMAQRAATYESTAHIIIDIDGKTVAEVTECIIDALKVYPQTGGE